ncbi:DEAD/DEAH box helicase [Cumulibacter manganitolerans]|uniref:DEAD/DEAH box helicase n=1 Tax=Cumulibacter manganitolerans TaxID=1884992 RepID=UPI00129507FA|nr:DEAD/DEAH box helicase [Cumulibacter manganitolerans]
MAGHSDYRRQNREDRSAYLSRADQEAAVEGAFDELAPVNARAAVEVGENNGFAAMGIPAELVAALAAGGIEAPFAIQGEAIPSALEGQDVLARAATGSGKTLAFGLPTLALLKGGERMPNQPRAVILTPTRELAMQVVEALAPLGKSVGLRSILIAGGMPYKKQLDALSNGVDLLIATPGRLIDLIERGAADLSAVQISVLDEADQMCDMGFAPEVTRILQETPQRSQRMLFSATLDGDVDVLVKRFLHNPVLHSTADVGASIESMEHHLFVVHPARKASVVAELASRPGRSIVFVRTKMGADRVAEKMREVGVNALAIHGGLSQGQRTRALNAFRGNDVPVLVATDVAARGIHIDDVELVIQADPPQEHKTYLHRAGRTARAGDEGTVVTLAMPRERRSTERLTGLAGLDIRGVYVEPGDGPITAITGGATPSGEPVEEFRPPVRTNPRRGARRDGGQGTGFRRGPRPGGRRDERGPSGDRGYGRPRRSRDER